MEPLFLTKNEVIELTGYQAAMRQVAWLKLKGWRFEINANRCPIIARKYAEKMLGCGGTDDATYKPDFSKLRAV